MTISFRFLGYEVSFRIIKLIRIPNERLDSLFDAGSMGN